MLKRLDDRGRLTCGAFEVGIQIWNSDSDLTAVRSIENELNASCSAENSLHLKRRWKNPLAISEFLAKESPLRERLQKKLATGNTEQKRLAKKIRESEKGFGSTDIQSTLNRLTRLEDNLITRRIFGQEKTNIDALKYMQDNHIALFNVEGLDREEIRLIMGYIMMEYHKAANKRKNHSENHLMLIDEAHDCQLDILHTHVLPKDREFGLCMVLLT